MKSAEIPIIHYKAKNNTIDYLTPIVLLLSNQSLDPHPKNLDRLKILVFKNTPFLC